VASFYNIGDRKTNIIHTKLRHRCSGLNADLYRVDLKNDPRCVCSHLFEDAIHFTEKKEGGGKTNNLC
jgi:hypothetical protein